MTVGVASSGPLIQRAGSPSHCADATVNPCTLCAPLGAALVTCGIRGAISLLHGGQGCATYIRRYLISHFREPVDIASSSFGETQTVFGGEDNLGRALDNIEQQYHPEIVAVASTCVAETVGEDVPMLLKRYNGRRSVTLPVVYASTPSYKDGHVEGFHTMVHRIIEAVAIESGPTERTVNVLPPMVSPADLRHLRELIEAFGVPVTMVPDYSDTLDGVILDEYRALPEGGTSLGDIAKMPRSLATLDFTMTGKAPRASDVLAERGSGACVLGLPVGIRATDALIDTMVRETGVECPQWVTKERGRLLDAYADGHKYVFGKRVGLYGEPELVVALASFLAEIGARPVLCATGARNHALSKALEQLPDGLVVEVLDDTDFGKIEKGCRRADVELLIGSSKGYGIARRLGIPLIRTGFPIHDRIGAGRMLSVGYRGSLSFFDTLVNAFMEHQQNASDVGYSYL
jgi:nitrogenase molybdenum-iron protein NifN